MKKKVLYITIIEVPYRSKFFNLLSKKVDLTVVYQSKNTPTRNATWSRSVKNNFKAIFLDENSSNHFKQFKILLELIKKEKFDIVIFGCCNDPMQIVAMVFFRIFRKPYILNLDGETYFTKKDFKTYLKKIFIKGAQQYLVAGTTSAKNLINAIGDCKVYPYYFSSLTDAEIFEHSKTSNAREDFLLVIGKFFDYKGLDVALRAASILPNYKFKFVGMGNRTESFQKLVEKMKLSNIEVIPFLQQEDLSLLYQKCKMLILPSRQECWGLVINEAASYGTPIVSTYGAGAAVEFLQGEYKRFLALPGDYIDLSEKIIDLCKYKHVKQYSKYLKEISKSYSVEKSVEKHLEAIYDYE